jgi:hypothetical protein
VAKLTALIRSHRLLAEAGVAVIALGGGVGVGFGISDSGGSASTVADPTPTAPTTPATTAPKSQSQPKAQGVRGQITAENGSTWTVMSRAGKSVTVDISSSTQFGTKAQPASASQFVPGSQIAAIGTRAGTTVTATRVFVPVAANPTTPSPSSPTTVAPSSASS